MHNKGRGFLEGDAVASAEDVLEQQNDQKLSSVGPSLFQKDAIPRQGAEQTHAELQQQAFPPRIRKPTRRQPFQRQVAPRRKRTQGKQLCSNPQIGKGSDGGKGPFQKIDEIPVSSEVFDGDFLHFRKKHRLAKEWLFLNLNDYCLVYSYIDDEK